MKQIKQIIIFLIVIFNNYNIKAQCWNNINTPTTDWRNFGVQGNQLSNNSWNWTQEEFDLYLTNQTDVTKIRSPFWVYQGSTTNNNPALFEFRRHQQAANKDFHPEDGWELVTKNFGINSSNPSDRVTYPFYALYNKYSGKLRCFMLIVNGENNNNQGAMLRISFADQRKTALFQHMKPIANDVVHFNPKVNSENTNFYSNSNYYWLFSETVVAYDPCTCQEFQEYLNTYSTILFEYFFIQESKMDAKINGTFKEKVTEGKQSMTGNPTYSSSEMMSADGVKKMVNAGQKGYKDFSKYKTDINKYLKDYTDTANRIRIWKKLQDLRGKNKSLYDDVVTNLLPGSQTENLDYSKFIKGEYVMNANEFFTVDDAEGILDLLVGAKKVVGFLPYVGAAIGVIDFFVSSTKEKNSPVSVAPTIFEVDLTLQGTLKSNSKADVHQIYTPGNYNGDDNYKPIYNNILGVFNILELPEFEYGEVKPNVFNITSYGLSFDLSNECKKNTSKLNNEDGAKDVIFKQYKPKTPLKYVLNPASDLEVVSVEAAIVTRFYGKDRLFLDQPKDYNNTLALPFYNLITHPDIKDTLFDWGYPNYGYSTKPKHNGYINNNKRLHTTSGTLISNLAPIKIPNISAAAKRIQSIENNTNLILDFVSPNYPFADSSVIQFRTDYLPANCLENLSITLLGNNNFSEVFLKVYVLLKHKSNTNLKPVTMILSYDLQGKLLNATKSNIEGSYNSNVWGTDWVEHGPNCCFKCGNSLYFESGEVSNYIYSTNLGFKLNSIPFNNDFFKSHNINYNGEQYLTAIGDLHLPDNSIVPPNSLIRAGGIITFGSNVSIGTNTIIESEQKIEIKNPININPRVELRIVENNSVKYNCYIPNYQNSHLTNSEISNFCNKNKYKEKAFSSSVRPKENKDSSKMSTLIKNEITFTLHPNPTTANFTVSIFNNNEQDYSIALIDVTGKVLFNNSYNGKQTSQFIETNGLAAGIYFVKITCGNTQKTEKLIIHSNQ
ncbi:MAG: T9SS type A sorting domain-containing protein [Bacteroidota bacterium]|nr:T9SS type A sorting domain-containing protein [Bacteroidota bacterium]